MTTKPAKELPPLPKLRPATGQARAEFEKYADILLQEWARRHGLGKPTRRAESPNAWFKREAYRLLKHYVEADRMGEFRSLVRKDSRAPRIVEEALKNPFKLGLLAIGSDDSMLTRKDRQVFGNQMLYAWVHDVPPEFLNAFLAISGGPVLIGRKLKEGFVEPGFEERVIRSRSI